MKAISALALLAAVVVAVAMPRAQDKYSDKYDNLNIEQILASDRLLNNYFNCLMERGPCTPDGSELKSVLPDALESGCSKCNPRQKDATEKVLRHLIEHKASQWEELQTKYDPSGVYRRRYQSLAQEKGVKV